jgi:L-seryl-tRNA(Ser) seleniumtransferase
LRLPSRCVGVGIQGVSVNTLDRLLRESDPPVIGRIEDDLYLMDVRTMQPDEFDIVTGVFQQLVHNLEKENI